MDFCAPQWQLQGLSWLVRQSCIGIIVEWAHGRVLVKASPFLMALVLNVSSGMNASEPEQGTRKRNTVMLGILAFCVYIQ